MDICLSRWILSSVLLVALSALCASSETKLGNEGIKLRKFDARIDCVDLTAERLDARKVREDFVAHFLADSIKSGDDVRYHGALRSKNPRHIVYVFESERYTDVYLAYVVDGEDLHLAEKFSFGSLYHPQSNEGCEGVPGSGDWKKWGGIVDAVGSSKIK